MGDGVMLLWALRCRCLGCGNGGMPVLFICNGASFPNDQLRIRIYMRHCNACSSRWRCERPTMLAETTLSVCPNWTDRASLTSCARCRAGTTPKNQNLPYFIISHAASHHLAVWVGWCVCVCVCMGDGGVTHHHVVEHHTFIEVHDPFYFPGVVVIEP